MSEQAPESSTNQAPDTSFVYPMIGICVGECATNVFRSLVDEVGVNRALETCRVFSKVWGVNIANKAKQRFGFKGSELEDVALTAYWVHCGTSAGHVKPMEIRDGKAVVEIYACPEKQFPNAPPEICVAMSHYLAEGVCQALNPEYEFIFTHHIGNHDDRCRYIVKKKSIKLDLENLGSLQKTIPLDLSQDELNTIGGMVGYSMINIFTTASVQLIGSERTLELALPQARETGHKVGRSLMGGSEVKCDIQTIGEKLDIYGSIWGHIGAPAKLEGSVLEKEIIECPCKGSPIEVCKQFEALSNGICEAINPDYSLAVDRRMSEGERSCHWVVRKKAARQQESAGDDSFGY